MSAFISFHRAGAAYESAAGNVFTDLDLRTASGWTGVVGANGAGKSTLLRMAAGEIAPVSGSVEVQGLVALCPQEVDAPPEYAAEFIASRAAAARRLRHRLGIDPEWLERWERLSMGERKRIQIGGALALEPDILCLDEPTNHLDAGSRDLLIEVLSGFNGIGLLVSHDRELLDALCDQCLFIHEGQATLRAGGVTAGLEAGELDARRARREHAGLVREVKHMARELERRREKARQAAKSNSKRQVDRKDFDGKGRIDAARVSGRDRRVSEQAGAQARLVDRRRALLAAADPGKIRRYGIGIPYGACAVRNRLAMLSAGRLPLGGDRFLEIPELEVGPRDRIALTGPNGSGKSTLLRRLIGQLELPPERVLWLPQELDAGMRREIYRRLGRIDPADYSKVMNVVAGLGSEPRRVLDSERCSPGEWRKLFLGLGLLDEVNLMILDEPTNHFDLVSIACLEAALAECQCALVLCSHDRVFLGKLCRSGWRIDGGILRRDL